MIVEGLVTSIDLNGSLNVAPMGPIVAGNFESFVLRPFQPSTTFTNLSTTHCGVVHVVDRVDIIAKAAIGRLSLLPAVEPATSIKGFVLQDCCRWFEFTVDHIDTSDARSRMVSTIVHRGERRPFYGFNRARHAVLETAILATRLHLLPSNEIKEAIRFLQPAVEKTGGDEEKSAFNMLLEFIHTHIETSAMRPPHEN